MSKQYKVTFSDAIADALEMQAIHDGQASAPGNGVQYVIRKAVRYWLNKLGHSADELDIDDKTYCALYGAPIRALPGTRKHNDG